MTNVRKTTLLEHALLGLLYQKPSSGYDLRKIFATTAMGSFSDSPGAIYPALRRLQTKGLVKSKAEAGSGRRRKIVSLTERGTTELQQWIMLPITHEDVMAGLRDLMLRFAFSEPVAGPGATVKLLQELRGALSAIVGGLRGQMDKLKSVMPLSAQLALESGIRGFDAQLQWAEYALAKYEQLGKEGSA